MAETDDIYGLTIVSARRAVWREMSRRKLLALAGGMITGANGGPVLAQRSKPGPGPARSTAAASAPSATSVGAGRRFFSDHEFATLDELADMILPADEVSGGARTARVPDYIDERLGESLDTEMRQSWHDDLAEIDDVARQMFGKPFCAAMPAERAHLLDRISRNERNPMEAAEFAFAAVKWLVSFTYYKSRIGIHDDLRYQGNVLLGEFLGTDVSRR